MRTTTLASVIAALGLVLPACGDDDVQTGGLGGAGGEPVSDGGSTSVTGGGGSGAEGGAGGTGAGVAWQACPLFSGGPGMAAECALVEAPLDWDAPAGQAIDLSVKRLAAAEQPARGQLWLLMGGPGDSAANLEGILEYLSGSNPDLDIYLPEHRGVGLSTRLGCPEQEAANSEFGEAISEAEIPGCLAAIEAEWGDGLVEFSTSNAARDLGFLVDQTRAADQEVIVYGISYGTMWANRYLQIFPDQPTAIALDSICAPNCDFAQIDGWFEAVGKRLMDACGEDPLCSAKLGADPWSTLTQAVNGLEQGTTCPEVAALGFDRAALQTFLARTLYSFTDRMLLPALSYRLARCSTADVNAFSHLAGVLNAPFTPDPVSQLGSPMLGVHVGISELWPDPGPALADAQLALSGQNLGLRVSELYAGLDDSWPRYDLDCFANTLASSSVPMLMLEGEDDFIPGSWVAPVAEQFDGPGQTFVSVPRATHGAIVNSPSEPTGFPCGLALLQSFFTDPTAPLDTSCTDAVEPYDFTLAEDVSSALLGTADAWDGDPGPQ